MSRALIARQEMFCVCAYGVNEMVDKLKELTTGAGWPSTAGLTEQVEKKLQENYSVASVAPEERQTRKTALLPP